jgi:hypothetical protein
MDLADVFRIFHPTSTQYTFLSAAHGTFSKIYHILGHKASLSKYKKIEIILCILSDYSALKLELNNKNNGRKYANSWKLKTHCSRISASLMEKKRKFKSSWKLMKMKTQPTRTYGTQQRQSLKGKFIAMSAYIKKTKSMT